MVQLHRRGPIRRHRLERGGRLRLRPRPEEPPGFALPLQRHPRRPAGPLRLPARHGDGKILEPDRAADPSGETVLVRVPPRCGLHEDQQHLRRHRRQLALLRAARSGGRDLPVRAVGPEGQERRQEAAQAANLLLHRVQLPRRPRGSAQSRLVPAHPRSAGEGRHHHLQDPLRADYELLRLQRETGRVRNRPRGLHRTLAGSFQPRDGRKRQAHEHAGRARQQHRIPCATM